MDQVCCHGNGQDRYARKDEQDRSAGYREDRHHNDSDEAKNDEEIIFDNERFCESFKVKKQHYSNVMICCVSHFHFLYISFHSLFHLHRTMVTSHHQNMF